MSEQPKCTLSNAELLAAVETWVSKLCDTGGRAWTLSVPINFNRDPDMLITELRKRYAALLARHNALVEAIHMAMDRTAGCDKKQTDDQLIADVAYLKRLASDYFKTSVDCGNRSFAAEQKYDALREAVAKMLAAYKNAEECSCPYCMNDFENARAEVDRLIANEFAADCEGEG